MDSSIRELWNKFKNGLSDSSILNEPTNITSESLPIKLSDLLTLNNGQDITKNGVFKLIRNGASNNTWIKYKYIGKEKLMEIMNNISSSENMKYSDEIPFATADEFDNGNVCLTFNINNGEISIVTFGFTPENYDLREVLKYVQDKNKISKDINEFLKTQIMFNEMEQ